MRPPKYKPEVYRFIQEHWQAMSDAEIGARLNVPEKFVRTYRHGAKLVKGTRGIRKSVHFAVTLGAPLKRVTYTDVRIGDVKILRYREVK